VLALELKTEEATMTKMGWIAVSAAATATVLACGGGNDVNIVPPEDGGKTSDAGKDGRATEGGTPDGGHPADGSKSEDGPTVGDSGKEGGSAEGGGIAYYGVVSAAITASSLSNSYTADTYYGPVADYVVPGSSCAGTKAGSCCYVAPPKPADAGADAAAPPPPPTAGIVTINASADAGVLATMTPSAAGTYTAVTNPPTTSLTWSPGDALGVVATGDQVDKFSGTLATGALLSGVSPALNGAMSNNPGQNYTLSWTQDSTAGETVTLTISATKISTASEGTITCVVADSAQTVTVDSSLLGKFSDGDFASIVLTRDLTSTAKDTNATLYLIGSVSESGSGTFSSL
jgi:hypothetical protein